MKNNIKLKAGTIINSNYWRIDGIKNIYEVFQNEITTKFGKDLSEYQLEELEDEIEEEPEEQANYNSSEDTNESDEDLLSYDFPEEDEDELEDDEEEYFDDDDDEEYEEDDEEEDTYDEYDDEEDYDYDGDDDMEEENDKDENDEIDDDLDEDYEDIYDFDYDEETGQAYMLPSQTPDTFKGRYNRGILKGRFSIDAYLQNRELQDLLTTLDLDAEKFWYLLLFCYDCSWGKCMEGIEIKESPKEQIEKFVNAISEDYKRDTPFGAVFKSPICITLKIGRKNIVIDNKTAIASIAKFCADGLETVNSDQMNTASVDLSNPHTESFSVFAYYFSQMIITALNYQEQVKEKRKKGANMSDKEKTLISHLLYFTGIVSNESVLVDNDYLKSLLKQYKDKDIRSLNAFYH